MSFPRTHQARLALLLPLLGFVTALPFLASARAQGTSNGPVTELAIRTVTAPMDEFVAARDAFVAALVEQPRVGVDREFVAFLDGSTFQPPEADVFVGMTQYDDAAAFAAAGEALGATSEAAAFFGTFDPIVFTALRPLDAADRYDLAALADQPGQVLEVAVRDLSTYEAFDPAAYDQARLAFLEVLTSMPGVVAEYQWVSILDPNVVVGMTVYESAEAFQALASDEDLLAAAMPFAGPYPASAGFFLSDAR